MTDTITDVKEELDNVILEPGKYKVVIYNDNATPIDFVIAVLIQIFRHSEEVATDLTMKIHNDGSAVAGVYIYEIAEQKGVESTTLARKNGFPLVVKVESE